MHRPDRTAVIVTMLGCVLLLSYLFIANSYGATGYSSSVASVFDEGAEPGLACPNTPSLGVANKTMPCGTKLRFCYQGRCANARVEDRGPYIAGREFDLDVGLQQAIGFPFGVDSVQWQYGWKVPFVPRPLTRDEVYSAAVKYDAGLGRHPTIRCRIGRLHAYCRISQGDVYADNTGIPGTLTYHVHIRAGHRLRVTCPLFADGLTLRRGFHSALLYEGPGGKRVMR